MHDPKSELTNVLHARFAAAWNWGQGWLDKDNCSSIFHHDPGSPTPTRQNCRFCVFEYFLGDF